MNYQNIETFRGLIKPSDINDFNFLKKSCSSKFFECATLFIKVILKIKIDTENHIESEYFELFAFEHMTAYVRSDVILEAKDKLKVSHKLYLSNSIDSKDDEILSKQNLILVSQNIHQSMKIDINKIIKLASTKPFGFSAFYPGPGVGGHCIPVDPFYLSWIAKRKNFWRRFKKKS